MIVFDLKCHCGHRFEAWFRDSASFERQHRAAKIACPLCGSDTVEKALQAPNIPASGKDADNSRAAFFSQMQRAMGAVRRKVEETCKNVGPRFAEEARKIHYGEVEKHGIYGEASEAEATELRDEGIEFSRLPLPPRHDA